MGPKRNTKGLVAPRNASMSVSKMKRNQTGIKDLSNYVLEAIFLFSFSDFATMEAVYVTCRKFRNMIKESKIIWVQLCVLGYPKTMP